MNLEILRSVRMFGLSAFDILGSMIIIYIIGLYLGIKDISLPMILFIPASLIIHLIFKINTPLTRLINML